MSFTAQDTAAARSAISRGDLGMLERYLREGPANPATFNITASAVTLNQSLHANKVLTLNLASGMTLTLPFATGTQDKYTMVVQTAFTSNGVIKVGRSADTMIGSEPAPAEPTQLRFAPA